MSSFPLYDNLEQKTQNMLESLIDEEKNILSENIKNIDKWFYRLDINFLIKF